VITEYPDVKDCVVVGAPSEFFGEEVAACLELREGASLNKEDLLQYTGTKLAKFKVPSYVFVYDAFPHLPNGKIDMVNLRKDVALKVSGALIEGGSQK
jgi:fatty-acyl-CoA synthase